MRYGKILDRRSFETQTDGTFSMDTKIQEESIKRGISRTDQGFVNAVCRNKWMESSRTECTN